MVGITLRALSDAQGFLRLLPLLIAMHDLRNLELAVHFFVQIAVILLVCRAVGAVGKWFGQPQVVSEMIAGVLLGPSFFGLFFPQLQAALFPWDPSQSTRDTQSYLFPASQLGLALYMFVVGIEFRLDLVKRHLTGSAAVSIAGMLTPFLLGAGLGWYFFHHTQMFPERTRINEAMLFLGASMCITAFPMLARIIHFKGLTGTPMGTLAIGAAAMDDASAWCLLALVLASFDGNMTHALYSILGGIAFVAITLGIVRPLLAMFEKWLLEKASDAEQNLNEAGFVVCLAVMSLCAFVTDGLGLHAVFGAFVAGTAMPRGQVAKDLIARIQPLTVALFLPLFFTFSGLNTKIMLLNTPYLWLICGLVLAVAITGKGIACWLAALSAGLPNREAMAVGALMNSRGLMELIIINIGLQKGVISEGLFATLVIMAVLTTLLASPLFDWCMRGHTPSMQAE